MGCTVARTCIGRALLLLLYERAGLIGSLWEANHGFGTTVTEECDLSIMMAFANIFVLRSYLLTDWLGKRKQMLYSAAILQLLYFQLVVLCLKLHNLHD